MWHDSVVRRVVASGLSVALLLQVSGCTGWSTQQQPPAQLLAEKSYTKLRVTRINDKRVEVYSPRIVDDTLVGYRSLPVEGKEGEAKPVSIALADIKSVEVHKVQTGKTVLLVIGIGLTVALIVAAASADYGIGSGGGGGGEYYGSCPLLYSWDGKNWRLDSGTFGGAIMPALQRTDLDNLVYVKPQANTLRLRIVNELEETEYVDALSIVAVDHRPGVSVLPDANGSPELHAVASPAAPIVARDDAGRNMLGHVRASDGVFWESPLRTRDPASPADARDGVQMTFKRPQGGASTLLVLEAQNTPWSAYLMTQLVRAWGRNVAQWYDRATSATVAKQVAPALADGAFLMVQVRVNGQWETRGRVFETGPEVAKRVALPLDLTGVTGETVEVRLESIPNFWLVDYAALGIADSSPFRTRELELTSAVRSDGEDVRQLLALEDQSFFVMEQGEQAELTVAVPPVSPGRLRSYLAKTSGWYRIHGAESADPDRALLEKVAAPQGASRAAIQLTNDALARLR
jgi:hypothetical protein